MRPLCRCPCAPLAQQSGKQGSRSAKEYNLRPKSHACAPKLVMALEGIILRQSVRLFFLPPKQSKQAIGIARVTGQFHSTAISPIPPS